MSRSILFCHCTWARVVDASVKAELLEALAASGAPFEAVPDLGQDAPEPGLEEGVQFLDLPVAELFHLSSLRRRCLCVSRRPVSF